jgi:exosortase family protein XrtF
LKNLIQQYKPFLLFLGKFVLSYLLLTFLYQTYLNQFDSVSSEVDSITQLVSKQTEYVLKWFDATSYVAINEHEPSVKVIFKNQYVTRIIEGCNALSVMILFAAFVVAFSGKLKRTLVFILIGITIIHILNILRIALLTMALYYYPASQHLLHGVIFPLIIYGVVFVLWVIWVNKYSLHATAHSK